MLVKNAQVFCNNSTQFHCLLEGKRWSILQTNVKPEAEDEEMWAFSLKSHKTIKAHQNSRKKYQATEIEVGEADGSAERNMKATTCEEIDMGFHHPVRSQGSS